MVPVTISAGAATSVGQVRAVNEDSWCIAPGMYAVADGMGGHTAGDRASQLAVAALADLASRAPFGTDQLQATLSGASEQMVRESRETPVERSMGTTVCGVAEVSLGGARHWAVFNIGDSRVYQYADGRLAQLTLDHSEVQELISAGTLTPVEAREHPLRNVVTRSLGVHPAPQADLWLIPIEPGQLFVLCSDGLTLELEESQIAEVLRAGGAPADLANVLVGLADRAGARDNVTVVVVRTDPRGEDHGAEITNPRGRPFIVNGAEGPNDA